MAESHVPHRLRAGERVGMVVSDRMQKTRVVQIQRLVRHPQYGRVVRRLSKVKVHDERNESHLGDEVRIAPTRPLSKDKHWRVVAIVARGRAAAVQEQPRDRRAGDHDTP